jgi:transposase InsO family protein
MNYVYTTARKSNSLTIVKNFLALALRQYNCDVKVIWLDGKTSLGQEFKDWAAEKGLIIERSTTYTPAQNGAAERSGKELIQKAQAMEIGSNIPEDLWLETFKTGGYLLNQTPNKTLMWKSPY